MTKKAKDCSLCIIRVDLQDKRVLRYPKKVWCNNGSEFNSEVIKLRVKHSVKINSATNIHKHGNTPYLKLLTWSWYNRWVDTYSGKNWITYSVRYKTKNGEIVWSFKGFNSIASFLSVFWFLKSNDFINILERIRWCMMRWVERWFAVRRYYGAISHEENNMCFFHDMCSCIVYLWKQILLYVLVRELAQKICILRANPSQEHRTQIPFKGKREHISKVYIPNIAYSSQHIDMEIPHGSGDHVIEPDSVKTSFKLNIESKGKTYSFVENADIASEKKKELIKSTTQIFKTLARNFT